MTQIMLIDTSPIPPNLPQPNWELPNLSSVNRIALDTETTGLKIWKNDVPVGLSVAADGAGWYIPFAHESGFNFDIDKVREWAKDNLANKDIEMMNAKFDFNMLLKVGIDLESTNNRLHDIQHAAALLHPTWQQFNLNRQALMIGKKKVELEGDLKKFPIHQRNSAAIAPYASYDALLTLELADYWRSEISKAGMEKVLDVEDRLIYCTAAMERNGAIIDVDRLVVWQTKVRAKIIKNLMELYRQTGMRVEPTKPTSLARLFHVLKIKYPTTELGSPSFKGEFLKKHLNNPIISLCWNTIQLESLDSKYLSKYLKAVDSNNRIRYALNQLRADNDSEGALKGTITGRFSSSGGGKAIDGINVQQVFDDERQEKIEAVAEYPIRDLFIPENGLWLTADAKQIEFRLFAHFTEIALKSKRLTDAYREDPNIDFHDFVGKNIMYKGQEFTPALRKRTKNLNFGKLYGLGVRKLSKIYLNVSEEEGKEISDHYNSEFPEAREMMNYVIDLAKGRNTGKPDNRGYIRTMLGRLRVLTDQDIRYNSATQKEDLPYYLLLNALIQGTAADVMKINLLNLYDTKDETGITPRFTVHDEVDGDIPNVESARKVKEVLEQPAFDKLKTPILWEVAVGPTWAQCKDIDK